MLLNIYNFVKERISLISCENLLPIAMAMGIRNELASSGVARKIISVGHVY